MNDAGLAVWLLEAGCYEDRWTVGVYSTPEGAMAAWQPDPKKSAHPKRGREYGPRSGDRWSFTWQGPDEGGRYSFDADWDDHATIFPFEVDA